MRIRVDSSALGEAKWHQYATRFVLGGLITAAAGIIAKYYGPAIGGLFLAFPAILPASATLIERNERERKEEKGMIGSVRGRQAASVDAAGAAIGSLGLLAFALMLWQLLVGHRAWVILLGAMASWLAVSTSLWHLRKRWARCRQNQKW